MKPVVLQKPIPVTSLMFMIGSNSQVDNMTGLILGKCKYFSLFPNHAAVYLRDNFNILIMSHFSAN